MLQTMVDILAYELRSISEAMQSICQQSHTILENNSCSSRWNKPVLFLSQATLLAFGRSYHDMITPFSLILQNISQTISMTEEIVATKSCSPHHRNTGYSQQTGMLLEVTTFIPLGLRAGLSPYCHILPSVAAHHS